jgi:enamine deaminase RidA (YjgF/YER057c/UK114 family)
MPRVIVPPELGAPLGMYSHGMAAPAGEIVVVAGQVGLDAAGTLASTEVGGQARQALANVEAILGAAGCSMRDVIRFQTFLVHAHDIPDFMAAREALFPRYFPDGAYPPNTLLVVSRLVRPELLVEIEAMAVRSPRPAGARRRAPAKPTRGRRRPADGARRRRR